MNKRVVKILFVSLAFCAAAVARADADGPSVPAEYARLNAELQRLEAGLPAKQEELARIRRKWVVVKGRVPTEQELKDYEKKRAKGEAKAEDNPYMNKSPLSSPGRYREAYYQKLNEIKGDEARIARLKAELAGVNR